MKKFAIGLLFITGLITIVVVFVSNNTPNDDNKPEYQEQIPPAPTPPGPEPEPEPEPEPTPSPIEDVIEYVTSNTPSIMENNTYNLVTYKYGVTITWESSNVNVITISQSTATVTRPAMNNQSVTVILSATFTYNEEYDTEDFDVVVTPEDLPSLMSITDIRGRFADSSSIGETVSFQGKVVGVSDVINAYRQDENVNLDNTFNSGNFFVVTDGTNNLIVRGTNESREIFDFILDNVVVGQFIMLINLPISNDTSGVLATTNFNTMHVQMNDINNFYIVHESRLDHNAMPYQENTEGKVIEIDLLEDNLEELMERLRHSRNETYLGVQFRFVNATFLSRNSSLNSIGYSYFTQIEDIGEMGLFRTHVSVPDNNYEFTAFFIGIGGGTNRPLFRFSIVSF